jgi:hypothetical protein
LFLVTTRRAAAASPARAALSQKSNQYGKMVSVLGAAALLRRNKRQANDVNQCLKPVVAAAFCPLTMTKESGLEGTG